MSTDDPTALPTSRRGFLRSAGLMAGSPLAGAAPADAQAVAEPPHPLPAAAAQAVPIQLDVNGERHALLLEPRTTLLDALRDHLGLVGTKKGCDRGQCGACTVLVQGERINACLTLAVAHEGDAITTIEGLGRPDRLHPLQAAFIAEDAFQCGYCTPGQICSATALLTEARRGDASAVTPDVRAARILLSDAELRERMSGNLCRCGAYVNIVKAVRVVARDALGDLAA